MRENKVWVIDDEIDILEVFNMMFESEGFMDFECVTSWDKVDAKPGDVVLHDLAGVGEMPAKIENVTYYTQSGSTLSGKEVDYVKPYDFETVVLEMIGVVLKERSFHERYGQWGK